MLHFSPLSMKNGKTHPWSLHFYDFGPSSFKDIQSKPWTLKSDIIDHYSYNFDSKSISLIGYIDIDVGFCKDIITPFGPS